MKLHEGRPPAPPPPPSRRRVAVTAVVVFAVAFAIRAANVLSYSHSGFPYFDRPTLDAQFYDAWAKRILGGEWIGTTVFEGVPLYAYFLALVYKLFGTGPVPIAMVQSFFGALGAALLYLFTRSVFTEAVGLVAAGLAALYGPFVLYESFRFADGLATFFASAVLLASLGFLRKPTALRALGTGLVIGVAALARERFLLFAPLVLLILLWRERRSGALARTAAVAGLWALGLAVPLGLSLAHNLAAAHDAVLLSSSGGVNFYIGNRPGATGSFDPPLEFGGARNELYQRARNEAERVEKRRLKASEVSSYWTGRGLEFWSTNPGAAIALAFKKFGFFWKAFEFPDVMDLDLARGYSKVLSLPLVSFAVVAPLALLGMILAWRLRPRDALGIGLLLALLAANVVFMMMFFVSSRFRLSVVPCLIPFAAAAIVWLVERARARRFGSVAAGLAGLGVFALFVNVDPEGTETARAGNVARSHSNLGQTFFLDERYPEAEREFREAVRLMPSYAKPRYYLAEVLYRTKREDQAERTFQEALALDPKYAKGRAWWGQLLLEWKHDPKRAIPELQQALHDEKNDIDAAVLLGVALAQVGRKSEAIEIWQHVAEIDPTRADDVKKRIAELSGS